MPASPNGQGPAGVFHAVFGAQIFLLPFKELKKKRWGFAFDSLRDDALTRHRGFLKNLHAKSQILINLSSSMPPPSLALRCLRLSNRRGLRLVLLGKVYGISKDSAEKAAIDYWHRILSSFPHDYVLQPIQSRAEFQELSGKNLLARTQAPADICSILRYEEDMVWGQHLLFMMAAWQSTAEMNEQIWRCLAACSSEILLSIMVRPTRICEQEVLTLFDLKYKADQLTAEDSQYDVQSLAKWAAEIYANRVESWQFGYLVQVHLAAPGGVPVHVPELIGSALTQHGGKTQPFFGYNVMFSNTLAELRLQRQALTWVELSNFKKHPTGRFPYLTGLDEVVEVFRLPYPSESGIPGVNFLLAGGT